MINDSFKTCRFTEEALCHKGPMATMEKPWNKWGKCSVEGVGGSHQLAGWSEEQNNIIGQGELKYSGK